MKTQKLIPSLLQSTISLATAITISSFATASLAGSLFLTGHDPDFQAISGADNIVAININKTAINYVTNSSYNSFVSSGVNKFLFVEYKLNPPARHTNGVNEIIASGYLSGVDFEHHNFTTLNTTLEQLGSTDSNVVSASDFGGLFTQAELDILNTRLDDIINFLNAGGGLYAIAEENSGADLTPNGNHFGFLPFITTSHVLNKTGESIIITDFGASLGLQDSEVNQNLSHTTFTQKSGLSVVNIDDSVNIITLVGRGIIDPTKGVNIPEPSSVLGLHSIGIAATGSLFKSYIKQKKRFNSKSSHF